MTKVWCKDPMDLSAVVQIEIELTREEIRQMTKSDQFSLSFDFVGGPETLPKISLTDNSDLTIMADGKVVSRVVNGKEVQHGPDMHEPDPIANEYPAIWPQVIEDMEQRHLMGIKKYGVPLQPFNGRDPLWDAYQEAQDLCVYLRQAIFERDGK